MRLRPEDVVFWGEFMTRSTQIRPVAAPADQVSKVGLTTEVEQLKAEQATPNPDHSGNAKGLEEILNAYGASAPTLFTNVQGFRESSATALSVSPLQQELLDYIMPKIPDPSILQPVHALPLLRALLSDLLPKLGGDQNSRQLAAMVIGNEIARQGHVLHCLNQGIPV